MTDHGTCLGPLLSNLIRVDWRPTCTACLRVETFGGLEVEVSEDLLGCTLQLGEAFRVDDSLVRYEWQQSVPQRLHPLAVAVVGGYPIR